MVTIIIAGTLVAIFLILLIVGIYQIWFAPDARIYIWDESTKEYTLQSYYYGDKRYKPDGTLWPHDESYETGSSAHSRISKSGFRA